MVEDRRGAEGEGATAPAPRSRAVAAPRLEIVVEQENGVATNRTMLLDAEHIRVGSHESNEVVLADPTVSRFHCRITRGRTSWVITDIGSLNGCRLDGVRVRDADLGRTESVLEIGASRLRLREGVSIASAETVDRANYGELFGTSIAMRKLFVVLDRVAASDANLLIEGESGTGKELATAEVVRRSGRARKPFVVVDCGAISANLIESELFGHARGAFTGADRDRVGAFEAADGGTVFLDEIGEMPLELQPKLLRALESREIRRIGETKTRKVDVRVIAATNRSLEREVNQGRFREDLFFRLSVVTVRLPPLRERPEDLEILVRAILDHLGAPESAHLFTPAVMESLAQHDWPGNVRELRNYVERTIVLQKATPARTTTPPPAAHATPDVDVEIPFRAAKDRVVEAFERAYLTKLLEWSGGNVSRAARKSQLDRMHLHRLVQRYDLKAGRALKE
jgi:transcriptional regulator with GAF, ATPase, and Fis domain